MSIPTSLTWKTNNSSLASVTSNNGGLSVTVTTSSDSSGVSTDAFEAPARCIITIKMASMPSKGSGAIHLYHSDASGNYGGDSVDDLQFPSSSSISITVPSDGWYILTSGGGYTGLYGVQSGITYSFTVTFS